MTIHARVLLPEKTTQYLYHTFVVPMQQEEYLSKYSVLPIERNLPPWTWEDKDFPRVVAVLEFEDMVTKHHIAPQHALYFNSHDDPEMRYLRPAMVTAIDYDGAREKDLHFFDHPTRDFDFVMVNQTLEHVYDPLTCLENLKNHMRSGGLLYFNVPACNIPHDVDHHYYTGFTALGIASLVTSAGFEIVEIGQWGSLEYIHRLFQDSYWPDYTKLTNYRNDIGRPAILWCLARVP